MIEIDESNSNVYETLGIADAGAMQIKSQFLRRIGEFLESNALSKTEAAQKLGISEEALNEMLRGKFRDLSVERVSGFLQLLEQPKPE